MSGRRAYCPVSFPKIKLWQKKLRNAQKQILKVVQFFWISLLCFNYFVQDCTFLKLFNLSPRYDCIFSSGDFKFLCWACVNVYYRKKEKEKAANYFLIQIDLEILVELKSNLEPLCATIKIVERKNAKTLLNISFITGAGFLINSHYEEYSEDSLRKHVLKK